MLEDMGQFISGLWAMLLVMIVCSNYSPPYREGLGVGPLFLRYISVAPFGLALFEESLATLLCFVAEII